MGGDGARFVGEGPGGKAKEEEGPEDLCYALPGQQSQQQEALPCPGKQCAAHTCKDTVQTDRHTLKCTLTSAVERVIEYQSTKAVA